MGASGIVRSHGPADLVAGLIDRLGTKGAAPLMADANTGMAGARVGLSGDLAILAMARETNDIRHIEKRYGQSNMFMIAGVGASYIVLLLWLAIAGSSKRRSVGTTAKVVREEAGMALARTTEVQLPPRMEPSSTSNSQVTGRVAASPPAPNLRPHAADVLGRYQILAQVGEGGMAEVFSAVNLGVEGFHRIFVLKRLKQHLRSHDGVVTQFIDEAKLAASLQHTNILSVLDFGCEGDQYFMVTDHVWGRNIGQLIEQAQKRGLVAIPPELAFYVTHELLQGLQYAHCQTDAHGHARNIVHRDVSVNNVMISTEGDVKLLDFGIAKAHLRSSNTTEQGVIKGNVLYMSPEQAQGLHVDHRSDIFSAGLVLLSMLTGHAPYRGTSQFKVLMEAVRGPQDIHALLGINADPHLVAVITKAIHTDPDSRYQTAGEFASDLRMFQMSDRFAAAQFLTALFGDQLEHEKREVELAIAALPASEHPHTGSHIQAHTA